MDDEVVASRLTRCVCNPKKRKKEKKKALTYISPFIKYCVGDGQK